MLVFLFGDSSQCIPVLQVGDEGKVVGIDHIKNLVKDSEENIKKANKELLEKDIVKLVGNGLFTLSNFAKI